MTIKPAGSPAWTRTTTHTDYGGNLDKRNFMGGAVVNALTDVGAENFVRMCSDLAAAAHTASMWIVTYKCRDGGADGLGAPTIEVASGMTGIRLVSYLGDAAPTGFPSAARNGAGDVTFTFAASYSDDYGVAGAWVPRTADAGLHGTTGGAAPCVISGSTVRVRAISHAAAAISDARVTLEVG